jgi:hypothetical protein
MNAAILAEWHLELRRRISRAGVLLNNGLPDPGFNLLAQEVHAFHEAARAFAQKRAA